MSKKELKVILLGDSNVGKTALMCRYVNGNFMENTLATVGINFMLKEVNIGSDKVVLHIWDTAGQEIFRALSPLYFRSADCCMLVYDVTSFKTFRSLEQWYVTLRENLDASIPVVVVGNKTDFTSLQSVPLHVVKPWADQKGFPVFECSARNSYNIEEAFAEVARSGWKKKQEESPAKVKKTKLVAAPAPPKSSSCC